MTGSTMGRALLGVVIAGALTGACGDDGVDHDGAGGSGGDATTSTGTTNTTGSSSGGAGGGVDVCAIEAGDPVAGPSTSWSTLPVLPGVRQETAVFALDGEVWVLGGFTDAAVSDVIEIYDPVEGSWRNGPSLPVAMHHANAIAVGGKVYLLGFLTGGSFTADARSWVLDPSVGTFEELPPMPAGTQRGSAAVGTDGRLIYLVGGFRSLSAVDDVSTFDTETNTWQTRASLPERRDHGVGAFVEGYFYSLGGRDGQIAAISGRVLAYDPQTDTWCDRAEMPTPRAGTAAAVVGHRIVVMGGEGNPDSQLGIFDEVEAFDTRDNRWLTLAPMQTPRHGTGAATVGSRVIMPGGATEEAFGAVATVEALEGLE